MKPSRRETLVALVGLPALLPEKRSPLGIVIHSYGIHVAASRRRKDKVPFADALAFLEHSHALGADGVQVSLGVLSNEQSSRLRRRLEETGMYLEGIVRLPESKSDLDRFSRELASAKEVGVTILRTVCLNGRRYETFSRAEGFREFVRNARARLSLAEPLAARHGVQLAVENHKDWRVEEFVEVLRWLSSKQVGICVDTGNSIALLEDPVGIVEAYAPWARTTHFKDMAVSEYEEGFLLSEVPLGTGFLNLGRIVELLREKNPTIRFNLEMITRDPLKIPCLTAKYWETMPSVTGRELAGALQRVRKYAWKKPLPRISGLAEREQLRIEEENVKESLKDAQKRLGLGVRRMR